MVRVYNFNTFSIFFEFVFFCLGNLKKLIHVRLDKSFVPDPNQNEKNIEQISYIAMNFERSQKVFDFLKNSI